MFSGLNKRRFEKKVRRDAEAEREGVEAESNLNKILALNEGFSASPGALGKMETWWRDHYNWLKEQGYQLRPRYAPDWVPSWQGTDRIWIDCEDGQVPLIDYILDATVITDGSFVTLKLLRKSNHPYEVDIAQLFSVEPLSSDSANHAVPIYKVLQVPAEDDRCILVMPLLRDFDDPRFDTFGEAVECFHQLIEGLQFIHKQHVAHRDCMDMNIMMDARHLYIYPYHPCRPNYRRDFKGRAKHLTRTQRPPKYYFIDFGISSRHDAGENDPLEVPVWGGDKTVPEFQHSNEPRNPFPTDVYYLGNAIRQRFIQIHYGFEFMIPLVKDMVQDDPAKRPNMDEVIARFDEIRRGLSSWKLRSRVVRRDDSSFLGFFLAVAHWKRRIGFIIRRVPAVPTP